jgi:hypothetical protein
MKQPNAAKTAKFWPEKNHWDKTSGTKRKGVKYLLVEA